MNASKHPTTYAVTAVCASCGTAHALRSTRPTLDIDVCAACHPVGGQGARARGAGSRIVRFERRLAAARR